MKKKNSKKHIRVDYARAVYGEKEIKAVKKFLESGAFLAGGSHTKEFEERIARLFGKRHGVMVNSGSSANMIAVELLDLPRGAEVITPLLTFGTTLAPLVQKGLVPVFIDVKEGAYVINVDEIESHITSKTKAMMVPSLFGNIPDMERLAAIAKKYGLIFIEDSCDTLGATYKKKPTGTYSHISTTSFYASHIITTAGCGGMVMVNDAKLYDRARMFRGWGRGSAVFSESEDLSKRFAVDLDGTPYDAKFIFKEIGYNFIPQEIGAVFGLAQLERFKKFSKLRKECFTALQKFFKKHEDIFILPVESKHIDTHWLAFPLTIRNNAPFSRNDLVIHLEKNNIQTRPIFTGNVLKHPAYKSIENRVHNKGYPVTEHIMKNAFVIGAHQAMTHKHIAYVKKVVTDFLKKYEY